MAIVFTKLSDALLADQEKAFKYVESKLRQLALQIVPESLESLSQSHRNIAEGTVYLAMADKLPRPQLASKETCASEEKLLDDNMQKQVKTKQACFLKADTTAKLRSGPEGDEVVKEERFTYLEMPFNDIPKFTAVVVRRTDKAEYCLITIGYLVRPEQVRKQLRSHDAVFYQAPECKVFNIVSAITDIAKTLATGLLKGIEGKIGALIFDKIFPPGTPSYFNEVYKQIDRIVKQDLTQSTIDKINGQINAMKNWIAITYTNAKESGVNKAQWTDLLQPREPQIAIQLVGVLMQERYAETGICVFMIAAGMHLGILQELALVDPNYSPNESHYATSVKDYAKKYADHATETTDKITITRRNKIQPKEGCGGGTDYCVYIIYWFEDSLAGYSSNEWVDMRTIKGDNNSEASQQRDQAMAKYKQEKVDELTKDMSDPLATAKEWLKLVDKPIPS